MRNALVSVILLIGTFLLGGALGLRLRLPPPTDPQRFVAKERVVYLLDDLRECRDASPVVCSCTRMDTITPSPTPKRRGVALEDQVLEALR
jgi:hypothetical protein